MILDRIENASLYAGLNAGFAKAFEILRDKTLPQKQDGKYAVDDEKIYYTIQQYTTKPIFSPPCPGNPLAGKPCGGGLPSEAQRVKEGHCEAEGRSNLEAHRKYIDIQFLLASVEFLGYAPLQGLTTAEEYNHQKDTAFFHTPDEITKVKLEPGLFCILFPDDAHLPALGEVSPLGGPACQIAGPSDVRKVVIKVRLNGKKQ
jgi:biofilm protein TabA